MLSRKRKRKVSSPEEYWHDSYRFRGGGGSENWSQPLYSPVELEISETPVVLDTHLRSRWLFVIVVNADTAKVMAEVLRVFVTGKCPCFRSRFCHKRTQLCRLRQFLYT